MRTSRWAPLGLGFGAAFGLGALVTHLPDTFAGTRPPGVVEASASPKAKKADRVDVSAEGAIAIPTTAVASAAPTASFAPLVDAVTPAVVAIKVETERAEPQMDLQNVPAPFRRFFDEGGGSPHGQRIHGEGSGFLISSDGLILTNNHVVDHATDIVAQFADGREVTCTVVGTDPATDVALVKLDGKDTDWPHVDLASSEDLRVGDWVVAVGNPLGLGITVTAGIVSGTGRSLGHDAYDDFIQTDAAINQGNSGGPLFDTQGHVVGMNTAIIQGANTVGFAVPADLISDVLQDLRTDGRVSRGYLGVELQQMDVTLAKALGNPDAKGALVASVQPGTPAADAGLQSGDVIVGVGDRGVSDSQSLIREVAKHDPGEKVDVHVLRKGKAKSFSLTLAERPGTPGAEEPAVGPSEGSEAEGDHLGITVAPLPPDAMQQLGADRGLVVGDVDPDGPADGKLRRGDVIQEVNGKAVSDIDDLRGALKKGNGDATVLRVVRGGQAQLVAIPRG
ncbi:MAG: Do family serine endopeptidase [Myxococcota bacterium]